MAKRGEIVEEIARAGPKVILDNDRGPYRGLLHAPGRRIQLYTDLWNHTVSR